jgi:hypothetical protein
MGGGYPLAGESGALQLTTPLDGSSTLQLTGPVIARNVKKWEVGEYNDLRSRSVGDDLVIHHVPQGAPAAQVIPGYDYSTGSALLFHGQFMSRNLIRGISLDHIQALLHNLSRKEFKMSRMQVHLEAL